VANAIETNETDDVDVDGLEIKRVFSDTNVHPFDQIEWATRAAEIKSESGDAVFQQADCEFPESYSQLACNVIASKYFYGPISQGNGSPTDGQREYSMRQLVSRVADTIAEWGYKDGYFETREDSKVFGDELSWLLVNQYGAFNSPVWFNVGLWDKYRIKGSYDGFRYDVEEDKAVPVKDGDAYKSPQGSACFITGVEDSIPGIYERAAIEGRIFKYGSGTGTNNSSIRSSREVVRGGGKPSGPLSFMTVYDAVAKVTKSGGRARRAAKMEILDDWHPDILEFIRCKGVEEAKAHALIREGYESNFNGEAYSTVCFQNSNMSVRFSDDFMLKVVGRDRNPIWQTRAVTTGTEFNTQGERMPAYDANLLIDEVSQGTWKCGDPGVHFTDTIQKWHTCKNTDAIYGCNPCSEFLFLSNTACNLASLNLMKFAKSHGRFDDDRFRAAVRIFFIAQEILVDRCGYPTAAICQNSHDYRPLGLGYCNLGALLMHAGLPYDSKEGRSYAAVITSIMHAKANCVSIEMASVKGSFPGYERNKVPMLDVMRLHAEASSQIEGCSEEIRRLKKVSDWLWPDVVRFGGLWGFRNAQATLLAPTGTIGFMMDAATTGVEPDIALVKYKVLAGGGNLRYVNTVVPSALENLGYPPAAIDRIIEYIDKNGGIEGCEEVVAKDVPIFDCAFATSKGGRSIAWKGHIDMMAAVQPFLSGAISKTVNAPESFTVQDICDAYIYAWRRGLKCVAIYRENSKASQPLSTKAESKKDEANPIAVVDCPPRRERLPDTRRSVTHKFSIGGHEGYATAGFYPSGGVGELFVTMSKEGSTIGGLVDAWATAISLGLQYGVPLEVIVEKFAHSRFEPAGMTRNKDIPIAKSLTDYISRWLGVECIPGYREANSPNRDYAAPAAENVPVAVDNQQDQFAKFQSDAPLCDTCGSITVRNGSCYRCHVCGSSLGCS
jgi:ribonucleoside-diphosphate reductase alpha chain